VILASHPDNSKKHGDGPGGHGKSYPAVVADIADIGSITTLTVRLAGGPELRVRATDPGDLSPGDPCDIALDPESITLWQA
jgi:hypothetical protein